jgi:hypothetical protein
VAQASFRDFCNCVEAPHASPPPASCLSFCSIRIQYSGAPGSVQAQVTSVESYGNLIPNYIQEGSAVFSSPKGRAEWTTLAVCGAFYNPRKATCGE